MTGVLSSIDKFAIVPNFSVKGQEKTYTVCGVVSTILALGIIVAFLALFSGDMINKTNPSYNQFVLNGGLGTDSVELTDDIFSFAFGMISFDDYTYFINDRYFKVSAYYNDGTEYLPLDLEVCSNDPTSPRYYAWCIKKEQSQAKNIFLKSGFEQYIVLYYARCSKDTDPNQDCATREEIDSLFSYIGWAPDYSVWSVDPTDYKNPMRRNTRKEYYAPVKTLLKVVTFDLLSLEFTSDNGWLLPSKETKKAVTYESVSVEVNEMSNLNIFLAVNLRMSGNQLKYSRSYDKIQDVLAKVSGIMAPIMIVFGILVLPYAKMKMSEVLVNEFYDLKVQRIKSNSNSKKNRKQERAKLNDVKDSPKHSDKKNKLGFSSPSQENSPLTKGEAKGFLTPKAKLKNQNAPVNEIMQEIKIVVNNSPVDEKSKPTIEMKNLKPEKTFDHSEQIIDVRNKEEDAKHTETDGLKEQTKLQLPGDLSPYFDARADNEMRENIGVKGEVVIKNNKDEEPSPTPKGASEQNRDYEPTQQQQLMTDQYETEKDAFNMNYLQWIKSLIKPPPGKKVFDKVKTRMVQNSDILHISKRLREIDVLKACLLTDHQRIIFDKIPKPVILIQVDEDNVAAENFGEIHGWLESQEEDQNAVTEAYNALCNANNKTVLDKRLLDLYHHRTKTFEI